MRPGRPKADRRPIGLLALLQHAKSSWPVLAVASYAGGSVREERHAEGRIEVSIPSRGSPDSVRAHLEYALRREPLDLGAWGVIVRCLGPDPFLDWIREVPTGRHSRRAWYLYELLSGSALPVPDAPAVNYAFLADDDLQFTSRPVASPRHRVYDNLLGSVRFCPLIRKTPKLREWIESDLSKRASKVVSEVDRRDLERATDYLCHKETKASFLIEREDVSVQRIERFIHALRSASRVRWYDEDELVALQNAIVDPRYAEGGYRTKQVYVGQTLPWGAERVHYPCPQPVDVVGLMQGWRDCLFRTVSIDPVCQAALLGFGFVFIHPFEDGNGRLHRFVIHATLTRRNFTPSKVVIPVSAVMLRRRDQYDAALEAFSKPILSRVDYSMDQDGQMTVEGHPRDLYRYWDATAQCEYLYGALAEAVDVDLPDELRMLQAYDAGRAAMLGIVDMPDRKADLMMQLLIQNGYRLSRKKRHLFTELSDEEVAAIESAVRDSGLPKDSDDQLVLPIDRQPA